jgi:DNA polymerase-4
VAILEKEVVRFADSVASRLRSAGVVGRTVNVKLRFGDFRTLSRSETVDPTDSGTTIARTAKRLLGKLDVGDGVRLLGVGMSALSADMGRQMTLDEIAGGAWEQADEAVDEIRAKFGKAAIGPAVLGGGGEAREPGTQQWGPDADG